MKHTPQKSSFYIVVTGGLGVRCATSKQQVRGSSPRPDPYFFFQVCHDTNNFTLRFT